MLNKLYLTIGLIIGVIAYGRVQYNSGYDKAVSEQKDAVIKILQENESYKETNRKLKESMNARNNNKDLSDTRLPGEFIGLLQQ
jgi:hypothetical protein